MTDRLQCHALPGLHYYSNFSMYCRYLKTYSIKKISKLQQFRESIFNSDFWGKKRGVGKP